MSTRTPNRRDRGQRAQTHHRNPSQSQEYNRDYNQDYNQDYSQLAAEYAYNLQQQEPSVSYEYTGQYQPSPLNMLPPQPPPRTNETLNLAVIQRYLPSVYAIVSVANYAVVYTFNPSPEVSGWEKADVEGTLFVCAQMPEYIGESEAAIQRYSVVIPNRRSLRNFVAELKTESNIDITGEYVILNVEDEDGAPKVYGIWIYDEQGKSTQGARERTAAIMLECSKLAEQSRSQAMASIDQYTRQDPLQEHNGNAALARSMTMEELFNKQREADAGFSIHNHHTPPVQPPQRYDQQDRGNPYFVAEPSMQLPQSPLYRSQGPSQQGQNILSPNPVHGFSTTTAVHANAHHVGASSPLSRQHAAQYHQQQDANQAPNTSQFASYSDTDFFRGPPKFAQQQQGQAMQQDRAYREQQQFLLYQQQQQYAQQQGMMQQQQQQQGNQGNQGNHPTGGGQDLLAQLFRTAGGR